MKSKLPLHLVTLLILVGCPLLFNLQAQTTPPPEGSAATVAVPEAKTPEAGWVHQVFGPAMSPLWLCSIILVALIFNRARATQRNRVLNPETIRKIGELLSKLQVEQACEVAVKSGTLIGAAWARGLKEFALGQTPLSEALANPSVVALKTLRKYLWLMTTISVIAPMFGLIGTVIGMIITFSTLAETGGVDKAKLAVGLSFALYKTAGGLIIAIPGIISGRYFSARVTAYSDEVEDAILDVCHQYSLGLAASDQQVNTSLVEP